METQINPQEIMSKLVQLQAQVDRLQEDFEDSIITEDERKLLDESIVNEKEGKLISSDKLREKLGI